MDQPLLVFVAVAEHRSFSRAAESLYVTQPAVSLHIQSLERQYGARLVERSPKSVRLTPAGDILYHHAKRILLQYRLAEQLIDDMMRAPSGPLSIGASYTFGEYVLPHVIARFMAMYPDISPTISIQNTERVAQLIGRQELDVGIVEGAVEPRSEVEVQSFAPDTLVIVLPANHRLAGQSEVEPAELLHEKWIVRERGSGTREVTDKLFLQIGLERPRIMEFGSTQVVKESVEAGLGITLLSEWALRKEQRLGTLATCRLRGLPVQRTFQLVTHASQFRTRAMDLFTTHLRDILADVVKPLAE